MYIGITGTLGSGKGEIVKILKRKGFVHYGFGDYLRHTLEQQGKEPDVQNSVLLANELRQQHGTGYIAEQLLHRLESDSPKHAVFESIRNIGELEVLKRLPGFILLSVDAPRELRWERIKHRGRRDNINSFEEFCAAEDQQLEGKSHEQQLLAVMNKADVQIMNNDGLEELQQQLEEALSI